MNDLRKDKLGSWFTRHLELPFVITSRTGAAEGREAKTALWRPVLMQEQRKLLFQGRGWGRSERR